MTWLSSRRLISSSVQRTSSTISSKSFGIKRFAQEVGSTRTSLYFQHNLRVAATQALHAALAVTSQRETKQKNEWYKRCFDEACVRADHLSKDDALHSSLLIFNELLRIANSEAERVRIKVLSIPTAARTRTVIGLNPVEWLTEQTYPATVESRTAKSLVTEHYFVEVIRYHTLFTN